MSLTIQQSEAIFALYPQAVTIRGDKAFDAQENIVAYDETAVQAKVVELQQAQEQAQQAVETSKASAVAKLAALGLNADEIKALTGAQA